MKQTHSILCNLVIFIQKIIILQLVCVEFLRRNFFQTFHLLFRYQIDDTEKFSGKTVNLVKEDGEGGVNIQLIFAPDNVVYWVEFSKDELEHQKSFSKMVRLGEIRHCTMYFFACCLIVEEFKGTNFTMYLPIFQCNERKTR